MTNQIKVKQQDHICLIFDHFKTLAQYYILRKHKYEKIKNSDVIVEMLPGLNN